MSADVLVIGGGIIGCAAAHELAGRGARVVVLDGRPVGHGATRASAGVLAPYIEGHANGPLLQLGVRSLALYDAWIEGVAGASGRRVEYARRGTLEVATEEAALAPLEQSAAALQRLGVEAGLLDAAAARAAEPQLAADVSAALLIPAHGFVAAPALTEALAEAAARHGATIVAGATARRVTGRGRTLTVRTDAETFEAETVVLAAGSWAGSGSVEGLPAAPVRPVRGQLLRLAWPGPALSRVIWGSRCYLVPWQDGSLLVGATVEEVGFDERATVTGVRDLLDAACELVPRAWQAGFEEVRTGLRPATPDGLPIVGRSARRPNLVYACGHFRNGVLLAPLTASLVARLVLDGAADPALDVMTPARFGDL